MRLELPAVLPDTLRSNASRVAMTEGQMLFRQGESVEYIYYVLRGELLAVRYLPVGTEAVMQRARKGEYFGQSAIAVSHYACDARATSATDVARLPVRRLTEALASDGAFALAFAPRRRPLRVDPPPESDRNHFSSESGSLDLRPASTMARVPGIDAGRPTRPGDD